MLWATIMAFQAETVGILVEKSKFEPEVALGVAEAIESAMTHAQFATVPLLDARLHGVGAELRVLEGKLDASTQRLGAELNAKLAQMEAKLSKVGASWSCWETSR